MPIIGVIGGVALLVAAGYVGYRLLSGGRAVYNELPDKRELKGAVEIGNEWIEIKPDPPLESSQQFQYVGLKLSGVKDWDEKDKRKILLDDGSSVLIEVELSDERGNTYSLVPNRIGQYVEFGKDKSDVPLSAPPSTEPDFPQDRVYTKVRTRSERTIKCEEIIWGAYTSW